MCYLSFIRSTQFDWNYILITPYSVYGNQTTDVFLLQIVLSTLLLSFIVSFVITELTYAPVRELVRSLEDINGSEVQYLDVQNKSEIAYIRNVVAKMRRRNDFLENELERRMKALNDTQLVMLQNQINPHFIYNTLDTINWSVIERLGAPNDISVMLTTLASLLRISLSRESYLVSVAEEINHAKLYLALIERRYRGRLLVFWDVDDTLLDCRILKLSLQPLIENALNHGLRSRRYNGEIRIGISSENGDTLVLSVEDDGIGMDEASLEKLRASLSEDCRDSSKVGIRNIQRRIRLLFGDLYGITLASPSQGLRVMIRCPIIRA
ncbi:MAG: histidine kinase [Clostridiaceae bacterium]|nr:histidine kinase [Clostridiaceae bacterium]